MAERREGDVVAHCNRPDCEGGTIDEQGFCEACNRRPLTVGPGPFAGEAPKDPYRASVGVAPVRSNPWYGLELVEAAGFAPTMEQPLPPPEPGEPVAEEDRHCVHCHRPVGRGQNGAPGRIRGYCPHCRTAFDFSSPIGRVIAGRYEIIRLIDEGAYGAAYLTQDHNLGAEVVLKALKKESVAATAERERDALVQLRHDNIVRIMGYEPEGPHLVLEYVPGTRLSARRDDQLPVLLAHGLRILQALDYLHGRRLLHCDVKPSNIMRFRESGHGREGVRLIDFGAVRSLDRDKGPVEAFTGRYAPLPDDPERDRPTASFDLYCLGTTLEEVCEAHLYEPSGPEVTSLRLLLKRAMDRPERRFRTASEFGEQLSGVIRQVVAGSTRRHQVMRPSALFGPMVESLHGDLGSARPIGQWIAATPDEDGRLRLADPFSVPDPRTIATALPAPVTDPSGPPLASTPQATVAAQAALAACRQALHAHRADAAESALEGAGLSRWHWLYCWYSGLIALASDHMSRATKHFGTVRELLPGELIPQLALGLCAERSGNLLRAQSHYGTVFGTTPALGAAGFGLARVHLMAGRRAEAVATAEQLTQEFRYGREARIAQVRLLISSVRTDRDAPSEADLRSARETLDRLTEGEAVDRAVDEATAASLRAEIQYAEFLHSHDRLALSEAIRTLAQDAATTEVEHTELVDLANGLRPPLSWPWRGRTGGNGLMRLKRKTQPLSS